MRLPVSPLPLTVSWYEIRDRCSFWSIICERNFLIGKKFPVRRPTVVVGVICIGRFRDSKYSHFVAVSRFDPVFCFVFDINNMVLVGGGARCFGGFVFCVSSSGHV